MKRTGKTSLVVAVAVFIIAGCFYGCWQKERIEPLKIAANNWVGYTPLFYAYKKGYLKDAQIEIVATTSLSSSLKLTRHGAVDGLAATQREYGILKEQVVPVLLLDRSYGGDMILANLPKKKLYGKKSGTLDLYLEYESINYTLYRYFKQMRDWGEVEFRLHNLTQSQIANQSYESDAVVISYEPYTATLKKRGFYVIETSKNDDLFIIDAIFTDRRVVQESAVRLEALQNAVKRAVKQLRSDPQEFYETVSPYLAGQSYGEFLSSLEQLRWLENKDEKILHLMQEKGITTRWLL